MTTILIVAGEASGDLLGADLMRALHQQRPELRFIGVGGPAMAAAGLTSLFPMEDLAVMGLAEVVTHIPTIFKRLKQLEETAVEEAVTAVITIDAQAFSARLNKRLKRRLQVPCIQYVAPKVWAWRPGRVKNLQRWVDHVLALLPFEPPYFTDVHLPCTFVGHPILQRLADYVPTALTPPPVPRLALLPGSRKSEIQRHWPVMVEIIARLREQIPALQVVVPLPEDPHGALKPLLEPLPQGVQLVEGEGRFPALKSCRAALAKSGTGNLELAVIGVPMVVGYRLHPLTYAIARWLVDVPFVSLVNWVAGQQVVPEYLQQDFTAAQMTPELKTLLTDDTIWQREAQQLAEVREKLTQPDPATQAANVVLSYLK